MVCFFYNFVLLLIINFFIMKKLSTLNLEKLAEEMQGVDTKDAVSSIGGDFYYTETGSFLGQVGGGNAVRVIAENNYNAYQWSETMLNAAGRGDITFTL